MRGSTAPKAVHGFAPQADFKSAAYASILCRQCVESCWGKLESGAFDNYKIIYTEEFTSRARPVPRSLYLQVNASASALETS
jgi:hypothetical protein